MLKHTLLTTLLTTFVIAVAAPISAQDTEEEPQEKSWSGKGEAGMVIVEGNSESEVINAALEFSRKKGGWEHIARISAISAENDGEKDAESYLAEWTTKADFNARSFGYGETRYFEDRFDSYEGIVSIGLGAGYRVVMRDHVNWELSAGVGYRSTEFEETGEDQSGTTFLANSLYTHQLTETTFFSNDTRVESSSDNTFVQNILGLSVTINSQLAMKFGYETRYNSEAADEDENTDTITSVNLVYNF
ncbi:YdiY family protein [Marinibactrum halimedae]|uniref:Salt-induced outer membrane protein n=1 Tax=Marinibactrum halimedae TaxID=1444977 RepID=A0AA37WP26_9GAMM|nr:DUF481 domain-containing protein [Marinibactrum halimedae]MCD9460345.1 DUF481 domain-containing protein [Marinibactrum halimedae]GLS26781.1 salt-induced outer membrane protein [Marinibactrum halimedae]